MSERLYLIDGTAIIYRSHYAFIKRPLVNSKGMVTSALYGTINKFIQLVESLKAKHVAISFDRKEPTFRHQMTEIYKANRPPMPEELITQIEPIKEFFKIIGVAEYSLAGYEADDSLATVAERFKDRYEVIIVSGDKDFAQLVDDKVSLYDPFKENTTQRDDVIEKYGLTPEQFIDYLAIVGDSADNIPGVTGVGPKGAAKLLSEYGSLVKVYDNLDRIKSNSVRKKLIESKDNAFLSQELAKIIRDVPLPAIDEKELEFDRYSLIKAMDFLKEYELGNILKRLKRDFSETLFFEEVPTELTNQEVEEEDENSFKFNTILVNTEEQFEQFITKLKPERQVAIDTETTSLDPINAELVGMSFAFDDENGYYLPFNHTMEENLDIAKVLPIIKEVLADKELIGHNIKYDYRVLGHYGFSFPNVVYDTMIASYLIDPAGMRHSLDNCSKEEFEYEMMPIADLIGKGKKQITFDLVPLEQAAPYAAEDAYVTWRLWGSYKKKLQNLHLIDLFQEIEMPLMHVLGEMEEEGVFIDTLILNDISKRTQKKIGELSQKIYEIAGGMFNINSTKQLGEVLFEKLGLPVIKKTKTGFSTDASVLEQLAPDYEIAKLLTEYRMLSKIDSTYTSALPKLVNSKTNRIHSSFNQTVASTGRLSSSNPNLQNIPIRSELGKEIRKAFIPEKQGWSILAADYSQIELRLLAILSKDPNLIEAFNTKQDIHRQTASLMLGIPKEDVTADQRRQAKAINFGIIYGMGSQKLSKELGITLKEAKEFIANYFHNFPTIKQYIEGQKNKAKQDGYVATISGRRLYLPNINSSNKRLSSDAERIAVNMPIQGSAADIIKIAMIRLSELLKDKHDKVRMLIQVHDELVFEVQDDYLEEAKELIIKTMEEAIPEAYKGIVPLLVDGGVGCNWYEAH